MFVRKIVRTVLAALLLVAVSLPVLGAELSVDEIMAKLDENMFIEKIQYKATMVTINRGREITKEMTVKAIADTHALVEFTNRRDRGTRYLKIDDELWMRFPDTEEIVKISGHMLRQGMMGSDISYEDALESSKLQENYTAKLLGSETVNGRECYLVELTVKPGKEVAYPTRKMWVDKEHFTVWKEEMYAQSGKLVKESKTLAVTEIDGRVLPTEVVMENKLRRGSQTRMTLYDIELGGDFSQEDFSLRALTRP
ncbi:MAG: outer membrane lipoprotein-sorting protein [Firmicutes bacterium]|nr:outer membrane lipoprotein-sorting protein [Bacillota bacterium]